MNAINLHPGAGDISLSGVDLIYEGRAGVTTALADVSFAARNASVTCLIGPSGCGKTTILRIVAGFVQATDGTVSVGGEPVTGPGPERIMVFQSPVLYPWLTVRKNILFGLSREAASAIDIPSILSEVGLGGFENHYPYQLSGGMRQRVQLARSLTVHPKVLLLDEPFGALDAQTRFSMQQLLQQVLARHRTTVLIVTHDVEEALLLGDSILVMSRRPGRIVARYSVTFARPRGVEILTTPEFGAAKKEILELLAAVREGDVDP